jgi:hypothetical protein
MVMRTRPISIGNAEDSRRPPDECPYPKPFEADFQGCPGFQVRHLIMLDSQNRPLKPIWSCRHMDAKALPGNSGRYYGSCRLGDSAARQKWAEAIGLDRIRAMQQLRGDIMPTAQGFIDTMTVLKARQLEARDHGEEEEDVRLGMDAVGEQYLAELERLLRSRLHLLERAKMPKAATMQLARQWVREVMAETWTARTTQRQDIPDDLLASLPESVRSFYTLPG